MVATPVDAIQQRTGPFVFYSYDYPDYAFGIKNNDEAFIVNTPPHRFLLVSPGLSNTPNSISFESELFRGYFLRHYNYNLFLHPREDTTLYKKDASFVVHEELLFSVSSLMFIYSSKFEHYFNRIILE